MLASDLSDDLQPKYESSGVWEYGRVELRKTLYSHTSKLPYPHTL